MEDRPIIVTRADVTRPRITLTTTEVRVKLPIGAAEPQMVQQLAAASALRDHLAGETQTLRGRLRIHHDGAHSVTLATTNGRTVGRYHISTDGHVNAEMA